MIRINLLPEELRGRARRGGAVSLAPREGISPLIVLVILALLVLDGVAFYYVFSSTQAAKGQTADLRAQLQKATAKRDREMPDYQKLVDLREQLKVKEAILKTLDPPDRILWSQKLNMLCYVIQPNANVFLTNLQLTEKIIDEETVASKKARADYDKAPAPKPPAPPVPVTMPVITQTLTITGIVTGKDSTEQNDNFRKFWSDLQSYQAMDNHGRTVHFMDGFSEIQLGAQGLDFTKTVGKKQVGEFTITLPSMPMSGDTSAQGV